MTRPVVLVTCRQMQIELPRHRERIERLGYEVRSPDLGGRQQFTARELLAHGDGERLHGIIAGDDELNREFFEGAPNLRALIRWGIGMDSVDQDEASNRGVVLRNTPGVFGDEVADAALGYILALARGFIQVDGEVRAGGWPKYEGVTLAGSQLGVIGLGAVGRAIAKRGTAFGMAAVGYDPFVSANSGVTLVGLDELLKTSRFVVLACPLTDDTFRLLNERTLGLMQSDAYLINVARGGVVDERALIDAIASHRLAGAGLDVFEVEPLPLDSPLRGMPNVILGAHNASNTRQGVQRASSLAVELLVEALS